MDYLKLYRRILLVQGIYTALTALWAIVDIDSFMKITGPKKDIWLVKTVSMILLAIGLTFLAHAFQSKINIAAIVLALSSSLGLAIIDFIMFQKISFQLYMQLMVYYKLVSSFYGFIQLPLIKRNNC